MFSVYNWAVMKASCASHGARAVTSAEREFHTFISFCPKRICLQGVSSSCVLPVYHESLLKNQSIHRLSMLGKGLMWRLWNFDRGVWAS